MNDSSRRKHERAVNRRHKLANREKRRQVVSAGRQAAREYELSYPGFVFEPRTAPAEFVALVREAVEAIDFENRLVFTDQEAAFWRTVKEKGARAARDAFASAKTGGLGLWEPGPDNWQRKLGERVFQLLPREHLLRFAPYHDYFVLPQDDHILVRFRSLVRLETPRGLYYHSEYRPAIVVNGQPLVVCFATHAIERVCERLVPGGWKDYDGLGEVFAYFHQCQEFEVVTLHPDQIGFTFYDDCAKGFWSREIAVGVLGEGCRHDQDYSYRVGYCPAIVWGEYLLGKTLLYPGYRNTPEYGAIRRAKASREVKQRMIETVEGLTIQDFLQTNDFSLLKWFHEHGVPQVISRRTEYRPI